MFCHMLSIGDLSMAKSTWVESICHSLCWSLYSRLCLEIFGINTVVFRSLLYKLEGNQNSIMLKELNSFPALNHNWFIGHWSSGGKFQFTIQKQSLLVTKNNLCFVSTIYLKLRSINIELLIYLLAKWHFITRKSSHGCRVLHFLCGDEVWAPDCGQQKHPCIQLSIPTHDRACIQLSIPTSS